jgi:hypothetical protein
MLGEIIGDFVGGVLRFMGRMLLEAVFGVLIKGVGYAICRRITSNVNPDGGLVVVAGLGFWAAIGGVVYAVVRLL